ncbi:MAG: hypothetical protein IJ801_07985 [Lachnospiraceae bacterium]|nr:hypothetical protein [Lachnospiraceae bacterium]
MKKTKKWKKLLSMMVAVCMFALGVCPVKTQVHAAYATPRLMVTGYDIDEEAVYAGEEFNMVIHLKNESTSTALFNVKLKLSTEGNEIITVSGSDSIYIDRMDAAGEMDVAVALKADSSLEQKAYSMNVSYTYEDKNRITYEDSAVLAVLVKQKQLVSVSEKKTSRDSVLVDGKSNLSFKINNLGKDKLYNVSVSLTGDTIEETSLYVGTINVGESGTVDLSVTGKQVGNGAVTADISYEDADGTQSSRKEEFAFSVTEPVVMDYEGEAGTGGLPFVAVGAVVVIIVIVVIIRAKKKRDEAYA